MKPTPKKKQPVKARKMYVHPARLEPKHELVVMRKRNFDAGTDGIKPLPVFVIDGSQEAYDAMVEQGAKALHKRDEMMMSTGYSLMLWRRLSGDWKKTYRAKSETVLAAINIAPPTK